jgi:hypothetical protein
MSTRIASVEIEVLVIDAASVLVGAVDVRASVTVVDVDLPLALSEALPHPTTIKSDDNARTRTNI